MKIIVIEGNIGSGKSTLLKNLKAHYGKDILIVEEPLKEWQKIGLFEKYCNDAKKYGYMFQSFVLSTRIKAINEGCLKLPKILCIERSGMADLGCFTETMKEQGQLTDLEYKLLIYHYTYYCNSFQVLKDAEYILLKADPEICLKRIKERDRKAEKEYVKIDYLKSLHEKHIKNLPKLINKKMKIIDNGTLKKEETLKECVKYINSCQ